MADWRTDLRALAALGETDRFPLLVYRVDPPSETPWPAELAGPSAAIREFYRICDGGYLGGHHRFFAVGELLQENRRWWDMLAQYPRAGGGPIDPANHDQRLGFSYIVGRQTHPWFRRPRDSPGS